jgi:O-antigen/teichoic acid export membrane protein
VTEPGAPVSRRSPTPLRDLAVRGGAYLAGREAIGMGIRLAGMVVVVRAIGPSAYGLYAAAAAFVAFAAGMAQMGAEIYLIRRPGTLAARRYHEAFTFLLCTSAVVTAGGIGLTYLIGPWLRPVGVLLPLRILLLSVPLNILWAPAQAAIERKFAYRRMGYLELGGDIALYGTAVPLAVLGAGPWSLVAGYFAWQGWLFVGSIVLSGLRPRLAWSRQTARDMLVHGWTYSLSTWLAAAGRSAIALIVGTFAGAAGVGFVSFAQRLVTTLNFTRRGVHRVGIVAISRAGRPERERLSRALEEGSLLLMLVAAAPFAAFGLVAHWAVPGVFGSVWEPALPIYVLLALAAVLGVPTYVQRTLLFAYGRNLQVAVACGIDLVVLTVGSLLLVPTIGLVGVGVASLLTLVSTLYTHRSAARYAGVRYRKLSLPVLGLAPLVLVPVMALPWGLLALLPAAAVVATPAARRELRQVAVTVRSVLPGRGPWRSPAGTSPAERGGDDVRFNGSFVPGALTLPARVVVEADPDRGTVRPAGRSGGPVVVPVVPGSDGGDRMPSMLETAEEAGGLVPLVTLLARTGRLMGALDISGSALLVGAFAVVGDAPAAAPAQAVVAAADALRAELRYDDSIACVDGRLLVIAAPLAPGASDGPSTMAHLSGAIGEAVGDCGGTDGGPAWGRPAFEGAGYHVRHAHVVAEPPFDKEVDCLVRQVVDDLRSGGEYPAIGSAPPRP